MNLDFSVLLGRDVGRNIFIQQAFPEPVSIIAPIRKKVFGGGEIIQKLFSAFVIGHLPGRQVHEHWPAMAVADCVKL